MPDTTQTPDLLDVLSFYADPGNYSSVTMPAHTDGGKRARALLRYIEDRQTPDDEAMQRRMQALFDRLATMDYATDEGVLQVVAALHAFARIERAEALRALAAFWRGNAERDGAQGFDLRIANAFIQAAENAANVELMKLVQVN